MKHRLTLTIASLLSILLFTLHWADEVARGMEPGTLSASGGLAILAVWLLGTLVLGAERRSGLIVMLVGALLAAGVPLLHMSGKGLVGGRIAANSGGALFWVWTLIALGSSGSVSIVLATRELWMMRRSSVQRA